MTNFQNPIVAPDNLPVLKPEEFNPVDKKYLKLIYIRLLILFIFFAAAVLGLYLMSEELPMALIWILAGILLVLIVYSVVIATLSFPYRGYLIREKDIAYKRGLITFKLTSIPYKRIQHVELIQGLLAKKMKLASIKVYTAGGGSDDLSIPGLPEEKAKEIRAYLTDIISSDE